VQIAPGKYRPDEGSKNIRGKALWLCSQVEPLTMKLNRGADVERQGECHILWEESLIIQGAEQSTGIGSAALMTNFIYGAKWRPYASRQSE
jgi:hypothetical protein